MDKIVEALCEFSFQLSLVVCISNSSKTVSFFAVNKFCKSLESLVMYMVVGEMGELEPSNTGKLPKISHNHAEIYLKLGIISVNNGLLIGHKTPDFPFQYA